MRRPTTAQRCENLEDSMAAVAADLGMAQGMVRAENGGDDQSRQI